MPMLDHNIREALPGYFTGKRSYGIQNKITGHGYSILELLSIIIKYFPVCFLFFTIHCYGIFRSIKFNVNG